MAARKRTDRPATPAAGRIVLDDVHQLIRQTKATDPLPVFKRELDKFSLNGGLTAWKLLTGAGCSERSLMDYVLAVRLAFEHHQRLRSEPLRMNSSRLRSLVGKTQWVARQWQQEFQSPFGKEVLRCAEARDPFASREEFINLPRRLLALAVWAKDIHSKTEHQKRPVYDDALAKLTEYVRLKTGAYSDPEVCVLLSWAMQRDYSPNTLLTWRSQHPESLKRARLRLSCQP